MMGECETEGRRKMLKRKFMRKRGKSCLSQGRRLKSREGMGKRLPCLVLINRRESGGVMQVGEYFFRDGITRCDSLP